MKLYFIVAGYEPAISKKHNDFLSALDLGISGAYIPFCERVTLTISGDAKPDQHYIDILSEAYRTAGFIEISVLKGGGA